jgi:hypothetical protein
MGDEIVSIRFGCGLDGLILGRCPSTPATATWPIWCQDGFGRFDDRITKNLARGLNLWALMVVYLFVTTSSIQAVELDDGEG